MDSRDVIIRSNKKYKSEKNEKEKYETRTQRNYYLKDLQQKRMN